MTVDGAIEWIEDTVELIDEIKEDHPDTYERGEHFLASVRRDVLAVQTTIEQTEEVTPQQANSIQNWYHGVCKWHPDLR